MGSFVGSFTGIFDGSGKVGNDVVGLLDGIILYVNVGRVDIACVEICVGLVDRIPIFTRRILGEPVARTLGSIEGSRLTVNDGSTEGSDTGERLGVLDGFLLIGDFVGLAVGPTLGL